MPEHIATPATPCETCKAPGYYDYGPDLGEPYCQLHHDVNDILHNSGTDAIRLVQGCDSVKVLQETLRHERRHTVILAISRRMRKLQQPLPKL